MAKFDYTKRLESLKNRRQDTTMLKAAMDGKFQVLKESYEQLNESKNIEYTIGAMQPVDAKYTDNTYKEGDRVKNQLLKLKEKGIPIEFEYQGSVTNNTHIKLHSDIDILTIHSGFVSLEPPQPVPNPYQGNPTNDLCKLREESYSILRSAFPEAKVDNEGAKSISLSGGSLQRKIDVVPSNWYDTVKYTQTGIKYYRGIMVLDYINKKRIVNSPFYHNKLIDDKDISCAKNYKKVVRLLKTLKADADVKINLSSYDIAALMYHMSNTEFIIGNSPLLLIDKSLIYLRSIYLRDAYRDSLSVPDESRNIFQSGGANKNDLGLLIVELDTLYQDLLENLKLSGSSLNKSIIS
jgi:hypothetical protein